MITPPGPGFISSFESNAVKVEGKAFLNSHAFISSTSQDGSEIVDSSNKFSQKFTIPSSFTTNRIDVFIARNSGSDNTVDVRILNDTGGGLPDTGSVVASTTIQNIGNKRPRWNKILIPGTAALSSGTDYWLELEAIGDTSVFWFKNTDVSGVDFALNDFTLTTDQAFVFKIKNINEPENVFELPDLVDYTLRISDKYGTNSGSINFINISGTYNENQPIRHLLVEDAEVQIVVGNTVDDLILRTMLIDDFVQKESSANLRLLGKNSRLIVQQLLFKSDYIGADYGLVIADLAEQAKLVEGALQYSDSGLLADAGLFADAGSGDINLTGILFPAQGTLSGRIIDGIKKIEDATNFIFSINNEGLPVFKPRRTTFNPDFKLDEEIHIGRNQIHVNESKKNMFNRILIDNAQTSDSAFIDIASASTVSAFNGTILASDRFIDVSATYSSTPIVRAVIVNNLVSDEHTLKELFRSTDQISVRVFNNNYPNATADYDFSISGSLVTNSSGSLVIKEKVNPDTLNVEGVIDFSDTNDLFVSDADLNKFVDRLLLFNSNPREFFNVATKGIPTLETNDIVNFIHEKIDTRFIYNVTAHTITYKNSPRQYRTVYTVEKYPFLNGESISSIYLYADDGHVADDSLFSDSEITARLGTYV